MASEEIEAINSSNPEGWSNSSCVIQVGYDREMREEDIPDVNEARIFRVPEQLRHSNEELYTPQFVSIGPFHYHKEKLKGMEKSKDEAVRRMQIRIQKTHPNISIKSFVEGEMLGKDKEIGKFYGEHISFAPIELAWIVTRDACFIYEFLVNYLRWGDSTKYLYDNEVKAFSWKYDAVFDITYQNPMREGIMNDLLLFENQIPLWVLKDVIQKQVGTAEAAGEKLDELTNSIHKRLTRHKIFMWFVAPSHKLCSHVLEILYRGIVGDDIYSYRESEAYQMRPRRKRMHVYFKKGVDSMKAFCREAVCKHWCKLSMQSASSDTRLGNVGQTPPSSSNCMQIYLRRGSDYIKAVYGRCRELFLCFPFSNNRPGESVVLEFVKLTTASDLTRSGVKIHPVNFENRPEIRGLPIQWVRFDEKEAVLYLPQIRVTQQLYSVMSNIITMELSRVKYSPEPMTQYLLFMDELIDSEEDVAVLRKAEVISNFLKSNRQVADFNTLATGTNPPVGCKVIDEARRGLHQYRKRKNKILWSEFVSAYFSKPWQVAVSIAAVLLLWMTMAQVLCLFIKCNP